MTLGQEQAQFTQDICHLIQWCTVQGGFDMVSFREVGRTIEQQRIYVQSGRSQTMLSKHLDNLAADLVFTKGGKCINLLPAQEARKILSEAGHYWESLAPGINRWGGNFDRDWSKNDSFVDVPHFERSV